MYSIAFAREATKALAAMPSNVAQVILVKIEGLARNPFAARDRLVVHVLRIGARGGIYK